MPAPRRGRTVELAVPGLGHHDGCPFHDQADGTTFEALNVRRLGSQNGRSRVGKRPGTCRHFSAVATNGGGSPLPIHAMAAFSLPPSQINVASGGSSIEDNFFGYSDSAVSASFGRGSASDRFNGWWLLGSQSASPNMPSSGFNNSAAIAQAAPWSLQSIYRNDWRLAFTNPNVNATGQGHYTGATAGGSTQNAVIAGLLYRNGVTGPVTATIATYDQIDAAAHSHYAVGSPDFIGPMILGSADGKYGLCAFIENLGTGAATGVGNCPVRLVIAKFVPIGPGGSQTTEMQVLATSVTFNLGYYDARASAAAVTAYPSFTISLSYNGNKAVATLVGATVGGTPMIPLSVSSSNSLTVEWTGSYSPAGGTLGGVIRFGRIVAASGARYPTTRLVQNIKASVSGSPSQVAVSGSRSLVTFVAAYSDSFVHHGRSDVRLGDYTGGGADLQRTGNGHATASLVEVVAAYRRFFSVDGSDGRIFDPITKTESSWKAAISKGSFLNGADKVALYRGRLVLASASAWAMTRVADWTDLDVTNTTPGAAIDGTLGKVGVPPDAITALITPQSDSDAFLFGCANSIHALSGVTLTDPTFKPVTSGVGVLGPRAWCFDGDGRLYFLGQGGLYRTPRLTGYFNAAQPECVSNDSQGRPRVAALRKIVVGNVRPMLAYDPVRDLVLIFLTNLVTLEQSHYCFSPSTGEIWPESYATVSGNNFGPLAVCVLAGDRPSDRCVLMGGFDGRIRRHETACFKDDMTESAPVIDGQGAETDAGTMSAGATFRCYFSMPIVRIGRDIYTRASVNEVRMVASGGSWGIAVADTIEQLVGVGPNGGITLRSAGSGLSIFRLRASGAVAKIFFSADYIDTGFSVESVGLWVDDSGRVRV